MKRITIIFLALVIALHLPAQQKNAAKKKATVTRTTKKKTAKKRSATGNGNVSIKGLRSQRADIQRKIREQEAALKANKADVKTRLKNLMVINSEIDEKQKSIETIQKDINNIDGDIEILQEQLKNLEKQLDRRKEKYIKSLRYIAQRRTLQDRLMFVFSAKNLVQMYRRLRFVREYASYQKAQGNMIKAKQAQVDDKHRQLQEVKGQKNTLLTRDRRMRNELQGKHEEQRKVVDDLQKQQKTIQSIIAQQRKKDAELNARIDRMIAEEVAKAKARAEAEAKRKAEARERARKKAEELARRKAAAEAAARENERRIAEAREREKRAKAAVSAASKQSDAGEKARAEQAAREARAEREAVERKAKADASRNKREIADAEKGAEEAKMQNSVDRMLSGGFEQNKGRLPIPVTGAYRIVTRYGQYRVEGLKDVRLENNGVNIMGNPGCAARSVYDGEVSGVTNYYGSYVVMVRHGSYISFYGNLKSVSVHKGQRVSVRQTLGMVDDNHILQFRLYRWNTRLNPEAWLGR